MNKFFAITLLAVGLALIFAGSQRRDSVAGAAESAGDKIATKLDGEPRLTTHTLYLTAGIVLVAFGGVSLLRRQSS